MKLITDTCSIIKLLALDDRFFAPGAISLGDLIVHSRAHREIRKIDLAKKNKYEREFALLKSMKKSDTPLSVPRKDSEPVTEIARTTVDVKGLSVGPGDIEQLVSAHHHGHHLVTDDRPFEELAKIMEVPVFRSEDIITGGGQVGSRHAEGGGGYRADLEGERGVHRQKSVEKSEIITSPRAKTRGALTPPPARPMIPRRPSRKNQGGPIKATTKTRGPTALAASLLLALPAPLAQDVGGRTDKDEILKLNREILDLRGKIKTRKARLDSFEAASLRGEIGTKKARLDSLDGEFAVSSETVHWVGVAGITMMTSGLFGRALFMLEINSELGRRISTQALVAGAALFLLFGLARFTAYGQNLDMRDELSDLRDKLSEIEED